jgi:iron complex outermembrane recepter protein
MQLSKYLIVFLLLKAVELSGQQFTFSGKVTDAEGLPLPGASIVATDLSFTTLTDTKGIFTIDCPGKTCQEFTVSYLGYTTLQFHIEFPYPTEPMVIIMHPYQHLLDAITIKDDYIQRKVKESPVSISVASEEFISRNKQGSLMKTLDRLPGISAMEIGSGQSKPVIRGLGFNRVVVNENGIKHESQQWGADHGLEIDQFGVQELEIVKGPVSLQYGSDAMGGVINIKSYSIPHKNSLGGDAEILFLGNNGLLGSSFNLYGRRTNWFASARYSLSDYGDMTVPTDTIEVYTYKVALKDRKLTNTAGTEQSYQFNLGYLGKKLHTAFYLTDNISSIGMFAHAQGLEPARVDTMIHYTFQRDVLLPRQDVNHFKLINRTQYFQGDHSTLLELGYQDNMRKESNRYISHGYMPAVFPGSLDFTENIERGFNKYTLTANLRHQMVSGNKNELNFGLNTEYQNNRIEGYSFIIPSYTQWSSGVYLHDQFRYSDKLMLSGGLRFDFGILETEAYEDWFKTPVLQGTDTSYVFVQRAPDLIRQFYNWSGSLGFSYNHKNLDFKGNIGKSYRMPTPKELASNGVNYHHFSFEKGDTSLAPEVSYQLDLSLGWNTPLWSFQLSPFINYFPNYIYLNPGYEMDINYGAGNQIYHYKQSRVLRTGGELQGQVRVTKSLKLNATMEYIFSRQLSGDKKGYTLPFSPPPNVLLNLYYSILSVKWFKEPYVSLDFLYSSAQNEIVPPEQKTPAYSIWNLNIGSRILLNKHSVHLHVGLNNLLNTRYLNHTNYYRLISLPEAGRNVRVSIKIPFHKSWHGK